MRNRSVKRFAFLFLSAVFLCAAVSQAAFPEKKTDFVDVVVEEHQTLWDIASAHTDEETDIRQYIYDIRQLNHISDPGHLQPGQVIRIPKLKAL